MLKRWQEKSLKEALENRRVVILSGARQCGKTTTSRSIVDNDCIYRTLDDATLLMAAQSDPQNFIKHSKYNRLVPFRPIMRSSVTMSRNSRSMSCGESNFK